jgi:hypothetical protein
LSGKHLPDDAVWRRSDAASATEQPVGVDRLANPAAGKHSCINGLAWRQGRRWLDDSATGDLEVRVERADEVAKAKELAKLAYEKAAG